MLQVILELQLSFMSRTRESLSLSSCYISILRVIDSPMILNSKIGHNCCSWYLCHWAFHSSRWWVGLSLHLPNFLALKFTIPNHMWVLHEVSLDRALSLSNVGIQCQAHNLLLSSCKMTSRNLRTIACCTWASSFRETEPTIYSLTRSPTLRAHKYRQRLILDL